MSSYCLDARCHRSGIDRTEVAECASLRSKVGGDCYCSFTKNTNNVKGRISISSFIDIFKAKELQLDLVIRL